MKQFTSKNQKIGEIGEDLAEKFLVKQGFLVVERNYTKKIGEIDIVAKKNNILHFIEIKTVSCENIHNVSPQLDWHGRETFKIRPEEQFHIKKFKRFAKTIQIYLSHRNVPRETDWEIDLLTVYLDLHNKKAKVIPFWNVIM